MAYDITIEGLNETLAKLRPDLVGEPMRRFMERACLEIENRAKTKTPVDTGRLRASLTHEVDGATVPLWATVGTNVHYAPFIEFGTGLFAEGTGGGTRHWPPGDALDLWARRHGFASGWQVARIIGKRGGLRARRYLRDAMDEAIGAIGGWLDTLASDIQQAWQA